MKENRQFKNVIMGVEHIEHMSYTYLAYFGH